MTGFCFLHQRWQNKLTHKCTSTHVNAKKKAGEESKWRVWQTAADCEKWSSKVARWFYPDHDADAYAGCGSTHIAFLSQSISISEHSEGLCIGSKFTKGSHSHSKGIVSRMWDRWLTWSMFLHLAFDLCHAFMLPLMWMGCKCKFAQIAAKSLFTCRVEDKILEAAVGP